MPFLLRTLGQASIQHSDGTPVELPPGKPFALLAYLSVERRPVRRDDLARLLWPAAPREKALQSVRQALWLIRRALGEDAVLGSEEVEANAAVVANDVALLRVALEAGRIAEAEELWQGEFLSRFALSGVPAWDDWVESVRAATASAFAAALHAQALAVRSRPGADPVRYMARAAEVEPFEPRHGMALVELLLDRRELDRAAQALADTRRAVPGPEFARALEPLEQRLAAALAERAADRQGALDRPEFVGRATELADLVRLWRDARAGRTLAALLSGPSGIGKTRLAEELARVAEKDGGRVVAVKGAEAERSIELGMVSLLVRELLALPGARGITAASDAVLYALAPSMSGTTKVDATSSPIQPAAYADALVDLLGAVTYEAPLVVLLDDVQWADAQSRSLLSRVLRQLRTEPVLFVLTYQPEALPADALRSLQALEREEGIHAVRLRPLTEPELAQMLALMVEFSDAEAAGRIVARIHRVTNGNPLFIVGLVQALAEEGVIVYQEARWVLDVARLPESFPLPRSLQAAIDRRLERLGEDAVVVAAALALLPPRATMEQLGRRAGLPDGQFVRAVGELVEREIVRWVGERIEFTHDQQREAVLRRFGGLPARWRQRAAALPGRWRVAAGAVLLLAGATALVRMELAWRALPQYGGGELYLWFRDAPVVARPPRGRGNEWTFSGPGGWAPKTAQPLRGPFVTTSGEQRWFAERRDAETPAYIVEVFQDGSERVIAKFETDAEFGSLSPDGELIAFTLDDPAAEAHDAGIIIANADGAEPRGIFQHRGRLGPPQWSPDGSALLTSISGPPDTVAILRPTGERVASVAAHDVRGIGWCGGTERVVFSARAAEDVAAVLHVWTPATGAVERLDRLGAVLSAPECSPDGRAVVYAGVAGGRAVMWLFTFDAWAPTPLPVEAAGLRYVRWVNDQPAPVVTSVRIQPPPAQVRTGERVRLRAEVRRSDGTLADDPVTWRSLDSRVAAVLPGGLLIGNHAGTTRIVATAAGWRSDTVTVEVSREAVTEGVLLRETFAELDTARWQIIGEPPALPVVVDGEPAVILAGDGNSTDGLISRDTFALPRGATLEAEFRLPLSRSDRQQFVIGLGAGYHDDGGDLSRIDDRVWTAEAEVGYPLGDLQRADSTSLVLTVNGANAVFSVPPHFRSSEWTHIALQVGPDGEVSLYVNRQYVGSGLVRLPMRAGAAWRVILHGSSVDTRRLVRNLVLWDGARHGE